MAKRVLIVNEGYSSNLGDQAIKASMENLMQSLGFETDFCYFTNPQLKQLPNYQYENVRPSSAGSSSALKKIFTPFIYLRYYLNLSKQVKAKLKSQAYDKVIIGGGQLINSSEKRSISFFAIALFVWAKEVKKVSNLPLYLIAVGAAGKFHGIEKKLYKNALNKTADIWIRDSFSQKTLSTIFNKQSQLIPDIAFFEPNGFKQYQKENTALVGIYSYEEYSSKFSVSEKNKATYYEHWKAVVERYLAEGKQVSLFYTAVSDAGETLLFKEYLDKENIKTTIASTNSLQELNKLLETAASVYSARMHALILAFKKGCQVEAYIISQKLRSFTEEYIRTDTDLQKMSDGLYQTFKTAFGVA